MMPGHSITVTEFASLPKGSGHAAWRRQGRKEHGPAREEDLQEQAEAFRVWMALRKQKGRGNEED